MSSDQQHSQSLPPSTSLDQPPPPPQSVALSTTNVPAHHVTSVASSQHSHFTSLPPVGDLSLSAKHGPSHTTPGSGVPPTTVPPLPDPGSGPPPTTFPTPSNLNSPPPPSNIDSGPPPSNLNSGPPLPNYGSGPPPPASSQVSMANLPSSVSSSYGHPSAQHGHTPPPPPPSGCGELTATSVAPPTFSAHRSPGHDHSHPPTESFQLTQHSVGHHSLPTSRPAQLHSGQFTTTTSPHSLPTSFQYQQGYTSSVGSLTAQQDRGHPPPPSSQFQSTISCHPPPPSSQYSNSRPHGYVNPPGPSIGQSQYGHHPPAGPSSVHPPSASTSFSATSGPYTHQHHQHHGHVSPPSSFGHVTVNPQHYSLPTSNLHGAIPSQYAVPGAPTTTGPGYPSVGHVPPTHVNPAQQVRASSMGTTHQPGYAMPQWGSHGNYGDHRTYPSTAGVTTNLPYHIPGQHGSMDPRYSQPHVINQGFTGVQRQVGKVFILYCKDQQLPQTFTDDVLDLADVLSQCGGFSCMFDRYVDVPPPNWSIWTEQRIRESQFVLLVCSPTLARLLSDPSEYILDMEKGKYYVNTIVNYIHSTPQKFIPVFLNHYIPQPSYLQWVPNQLHASAAYRLNISELRSALSISEDAPRHVFDETLRVTLNDDRFGQVAKLVNHLRGETATSPPVPPQYPIPIDPLLHSLHEYIPKSELDTIAERMSREWFTLGIKLGLGYTQLRNLQTKHSGKDQVQACLEMFSLWQQTKGRSATRKALKDVLVKMEYGRLAKELFPDV